MTDGNSATQNAHAILNNRLTRRLMNAVTGASTTPPGTPSTGSPADSANPDRRSNDAGSDGHVGCAGGPSEGANTVGAGTVGAGSGGSNGAGTLTISTGPSGPTITIGSDDRSMREYIENLAARYSMPGSFFTRMKRAQPETDDQEDDHDMQGKDVPTQFKRKRNARDDPPLGPGGPDQPGFAAMYPEFTPFNRHTSNTFTLSGLSSLGPVDTGIVNQRTISAPPGQGSVGGPSALGKRPSASRPAGRDLRRQLLDEIEEEEDEASMRAVGSDADARGRAYATAALTSGQGNHGSNAQAHRKGMHAFKKSQRRNDEPSSDDQMEDVQPQNSRKGKERETPAAPLREETPGMSEMEDESTPPAGSRQHPFPRNKHAGRVATPAPSSFVTQAELADIQLSLRQLNNSMGRLVSLVGEQTQFFSTMQARGFAAAKAHETPQAHSTPQNGNASPGTPDAATTARLRRRHARDPEPTALPASRDPVLNAFLAEVRKVLRDLMGRKSSKDPIPDAAIATDADVEDYDPSSGPPCAIEDFRVDLSASVSSPWNAAVIELFVTHYLSLHPAVDEEQLRKVFQSHLRYLCRDYQQSTEGAAAVERRRKSANRSERQRNLWHRRLAAAALFPELTVHIPMLQSLGPHGMSSDESDHEPNGTLHYRILRKPWRNPLLAPWLRLFDRVYGIARLGSMSGAQPHARSPSSIVSMHRPPVRGLPWNAYDKQWFDSLTGYHRDILRARMDVTYDFNHSAEIQNYATQPAA